MKERRFNLGLGPIDLAPGEVKRVDVQPKCRFRGERLITPLLPGVLVSSLFVGRRELLGGREVALDGTVAEVDELRAAEAHPAHTITVEFANRSGDPKKVFMTVAGVAL